VLPVALILVISPVLELTVIGGLIAFSVRTGRRPLAPTA